MRNELEKGGGAGRAGGDRTGGSLELGILPALCPGGFLWDLGTKVGAFVVYFGWSSFS